MSTPSRITRRNLGERWIHAAPWIEVRGEALATLVASPGLERLNWYDGGSGSLRHHLAGRTAPGALDQARATLEPAFAQLDQGLYQVTESGRPPWTLSASPLVDNRFAVAHTVWVDDQLELRVSETTALVVGSLLLDLATALTRLAPSDRPPADPPGSGQSGQLPCAVFEDLAAGTLRGRATVERALAAGWDHQLATDLAEAFDPPVLSVEALSVSSVDHERTAVETRRLWVAHSGWTWRAEQVIALDAEADQVDEVRLTRLGPDDAIRTVFEPLAWFTRWGRRS